MENRLLIHSGHVLTMAGTAYRQGCVYIEDGKIVEVADGPGRLNSPAGRRLAEALIREGGLGKRNGGRTASPKDSSREDSPMLLDASGCLVMPGLIEAHCHMGITEEKKGMEGDDCNENVSPVTPWLRAVDAVNTMDAAFDDALRAGITSVMVGPGSANVVGGQFAFLKTKGRCIDELIVKAPAALKVAFGENPKVNYSGQGKSPSTRMAIAGILREELTKAVSYRKKKREADKGFEPDFRTEPYLPVLEREIPLKAHVHRADDIFTAIRIAKEFGVRMTLDHCTEGHLIAEEIAASGFPAIVGPDLSSRSKIEVANMAFKTAGALHKAGVKVAVTTDHPVSLIWSLPICAGLAVKNGLPMEAGYAAITCNAAQICGVYDRVGSLEAGKDADIAIFSGNPMETFTRTMCTIIDGRIAYRDEMF